MADDRYIRGLFSERDDSRQQSPTRRRDESRHYDQAARVRHGEQRPLPRRPTGPFDVRPQQPLPTPVRKTTRRTTARHTGGGDFDNNPMCMSDDGTVYSHGQDDAPGWSWKAMIASVTSMTLFASVFGLIGVLFASLAYSDHKAGDYRRAKFKSRLAWFFALFGITVTVFALVFLFVVMYALNVPKPTFKDSEYWVPPWLYEQLESQ